MPTPALKRIEGRTRTPRTYTIAIVEDGTGRIIREKKISELVAFKICNIVDTGAGVADALGELVRAGQTISRQIDNLPGDQSAPPRKLPRRRS